jgi:hypothetical protein
MPTLIDHAVAAPREISIGGKTLQASPLRIADIGQLERWMRQQHIDGGRKSATALTIEADQLVAQTIEDVEDPKQRKLVRADLERRLQADKILILDRAHEAAAKSSLLSMSGWSMLWSVEGMARIMWLSLKQQHPDLTLDEVAVLMLHNSSGSEEIVEQVLNDSGFKMAESGSTDDDEEDDDPAAGVAKSPTVDATDAGDVQTQPDTHP